MSDLKAQARAFGEAVAAKEAEAAQKWSAFDVLRKSAVAEGVDFTKNADAFDKLNDASKEYDLVRDEVSAMKAKQADLLRMAGEAAPERREEAKAADEAATTLAERFMKSREYAELKASGTLDVESSPVRMSAVKIASGAEVKALVSTTDVGTTSVTQSHLFRRDRLNMIVPAILAPLNILDVIPVGTTDVDALEWVQETGFGLGVANQNQAATIAESSIATATTAAESGLAFTTKTEGVREIAHWLPLTKKMLQDAGMIEAWAQNRLVYGLRARLQQQVVAGNGTAPNLKGLSQIVSADGGNTQARGTDSRADAIHKAITQIRLNAEDAAFPQFIGLHPTDMETLRLEKTTSGDYFYGDASSASYTGGTIWGLTPVVSTAFTQGTAYVFDPAVLQLFFHNSGLSVSMSDSHSTFFTERKVAMLATVRAGLVCYQPKGITQVTGL